MSNMSLLQSFGHLGVFEGYDGFNEFYLAIFRGKFRPNIIRTKPRGLTTLCDGTRNFDRDGDQGRD